MLAGTGAGGAGLIAASPGVLPGLVGTASAATSSGRLGRPGPGVPSDSGLFGRMLPGLPPFAEASDTVRAALLEVGMRGGIMDADDDLAAGPKNLIVDPAVHVNPTPNHPHGTNRDNPPRRAE